MRFGLKFSLRLNCRLDFSLSFWLQGPPSGHFTNSHGIVHRETPTSTATRQSADPRSQDYHGRCASWNQTAATAAWRSAVCSRCLGRRYQALRCTDYKHQWHYYNMKQKTIISKHIFHYASKFHSLLSVFICFNKDKSKDIYMYYNWLQLQNWWSLQWTSVMSVNNTHLYEMRFCTTVSCSQQWWYLHTRASKETSILKANKRKLQNQNTENLGNIFTHTHTNVVQYASLTV